MPVCDLCDACRINRRSDCGFPACSKACDTAIFRPRGSKRIITPEIRLPDWAEDKARVIAMEKGWDYHALMREWKEFAASQPSPPMNAGAAFIGFCKQKESLR